MKGIFRLSQLIENQSRNAYRAPPPIGFRRRRPAAATPRGVVLREACPPMAVRPSSISGQKKNSKLELPQKGLGGRVYG